MVVSLVLPRLQMKRLGYDVIPLQLDKIPYTGWPTQPNSGSDIVRWRGVATGVRMRGTPSLFAVDIDVRIEAIRDQIIAAYRERWPEFLAKCLWRHAGAVKLMLIGRASTAVGMRQSGRWYDFPVLPDDKGNLIEVFTSNTKRQIAVQGVHSPGRSYEYIGRPIWEMPLDALPWFPDAGIEEALAIADTIMERHGLAQRAPLRAVRSSSRAPASRTCSSELVWDLEPDMRITLSTGEELALGELEKRVARDGAGRITAFATLWDKTSITPDRVLVNRSSTGLALWDSKTGESHRMKHRSPLAELAEFLAAVGEMARAGRVS